MSFSKAKILRFNDVKPTAPASTACNALTKNKEKGSVCSHPKRNVELKSPSSETGSSKSVPCRFRTTNVINKKPVINNNNRIMLCGKRKHGVYCAAKDCNSNQGLEHLRFFRFPKDNQRAKIWAMASDRDDLMSNLDTLNQSHRLCSLHFEDKMFMNKELKRLVHNAVPTIFTCLEGSSKSADHTYSRPPLIVKTPAVDVENKENKDHVPTLPNKPKTTSAAPKSKGLFSGNVDSEALKEKIVECDNKDAFIKSLTEEIEELKNKISDLDKQTKQLDTQKQEIQLYVSNLKIDHENEIKKLVNEFEDSINKITEEKVKATDGIILAKKEYEELKAANRREITELKENCDKFNVLYNKSVDECKELINEKNLLIKKKEQELDVLENKCIEMQKNHCMEIETLKKEHQIEIQDIEFEMLKTLTELQKEKEHASRKIQAMEVKMNKAISELENKFKEEQEHLLKQYEDNVSQVTDQVKQAEEYQLKIKLEEMENSWKKKLEVQQEQSDAILKECQTISEYNIIQCELEKKATETTFSQKIEQLESQILRYKEVFVDYENLKQKYSELERTFSISVKELQKTNNCLNSGLREKNNEIKKHLEENRAYAITIKNCQNTIEVLKKRLIESDKDVEQLKRELSDNEVKLIEYESRCLQLVSDLKQAQDYNEELEMQYESTVKLNTSEIEKLKIELLEKVENYRQEAVSLSEKLTESEKIKNEIMQLLHTAHGIIEKSKTELDCINNQYQFEIEQSQNELEDYRIREMDWNNLKERLEFTIKELEGMLEMKQSEVVDFKNQVVQLQDKCESHLQHLEYYEDKITEYETELDEMRIIQKKYIEQSGKYDELLQRFEQLERENMEKQKEILKRSDECNENNSYTDKYNQLKAAFDMLSEKYEQLQKENSGNRKKGKDTASQQQLLKEKLEKAKQEKDILLERYSYLEEALNDVSDKYVDLAGHHNNKQKIRHLVDLKSKNEALTQVGICNI
ncbi:hypothetical protein NQ315_014963 [Exocentrus adspersus]|uniref:THAP-type domain-containing protein n=1 Tax=Exocentrus adspersus TaxID=1586481 RepID=A0AAV8V7W1_9CUCU|nr:hypothetical protein NQ315_014963 [Exocentrus adspersus]